MKTLLSEFDFFLSKIIFCYINPILLNYYKPVNTYINFIAKQQYKKGNKSTQNKNIINFYDDKIEILIVF